MPKANDLLKLLNRMDDADVNQVISICGAWSHVARNVAKNERIAQLLAWISDRADRAAGVDQAIRDVDVGLPSSVLPPLSHEPAGHDSHVQPATKPDDTPVPCQADQPAPTDAADGNQPAGQDALRVFICYSRRDVETAKELFEWLHSEGTEPWLDLESLVPGVTFEDEIRQAVTASDVFLVCLSSQVVNSRQYVHREIRFALDAALSVPEGQIYIVPLRLDECDLPPSLSHWQAVDYFADRKKALRGLRKTLARVRKQTEADPCRS